jgi:hypothetical protein
LISWIPDQALPRKAIAFPGNARAFSAKVKIGFAPENALNINLAIFQADDRFTVISKWPMSGMTNEQMRLGTNGSFHQKPDSG